MTPSDLSVQSAPSRPNIFNIPIQLKAGLALILASSILDRVHSMSSSAVEIEGS